MEYKIEITETLQRVVTIEAADEKEALAITKKLYRDEEIVLDSSDYIDTEIDVFCKENV